MAKRIRKSKQNSKKYMELAVAVPQVIAHRVTRAALSGPVMSERDRKEFQRMVTEKQAAFARAYWEMTRQMCRANLQLTTTLLRAFFAPFSFAALSVASAMAQPQHAVAAVLGSGLGPILRTAVSNARRLSKVPLL
jgi:hypothetical protein